MGNRSRRFTCWISEEAVIEFRKDVEFINFKSSDSEYKIVYITDQENDEILLLKEENKKLKRDLNAKIEENKKLKTENERIQREKRFT